MNDSNDNGGGLLMMGRRKKATTRNTRNLLVSQSTDDDKIQFYITPQIKIDRILTLIQEAVDRKLAEDADNRLYDPVRAKLMCQALSKDIRVKVKDMQLERYRIVCIVAIVEKQLGTVCYKMKLCVDGESDYYGNFKYETAQYYIIVTVLIVYKDWDSGVPTP